MRNIWRASSLPFPPYPNSVTLAARELFVRLVVTPDCGLLGVWWEMMDRSDLQGAWQRDSDWERKCAVWSCCRTSLSNTVGCEFCLCPSLLAIVLRFSFTLSPYPQQGEGAFIGIRGAYRRKCLPVWWQPLHTTWFNFTIYKCGVCTYKFPLDLVCPNLGPERYSESSICEWSSHLEHWPQKNGNHSENLLVTGKMRVMSSKKSPGQWDGPLSLSWGAKVGFFRKTFPRICWKCLLSPAFSPTNSCFQILFLLSPESQQDVWHFQSIISRSSATVGVSNWRSLESRITEIQRNAEDYALKYI